MILETAICENDLLDLEALARTCPVGSFVEVGVWRGGSAQRIEAIAKEQGRKFYAYDTFEGMPYADEIDYQKVGDFRETSFENVRDSLPDTIVVKGIFPESALEMGTVAFAHIDVDQYRAIKESAIYLEPFMAKGGIMLFDDAGVTFMPGATKAVMELYENRIEKTPHGKYFVRF